VEHRKYDTEMGLNGINRLLYEAVDCIRLTQDGEPALVKTAMNLRVPQHCSTS
jgi:hypothetical protein